MTLHDWLNVAVLLANAATMVLCCTVLWRINELYAWIHWMREWLSQIEHRLKELEDWVQK